MSALNGAWRTICQFIGRSNTAGGADTGTNGGVRRRGDAPPVVFGGGQLHGFYERLRAHMLEARRNNQLTMYEEMRKDRRAKRKALSLLMGQLNPEQREEFRKSRYFHVTGGNSGSRYRIRVASFANIDVLGDSGRVKHRLCAHPAGDVPVYDVMAAQLLHLQDPAAEPRFLQQANVHPALSEDRVRSRATWIA